MVACVPITSSHIIGHGLSECTMASHGYTMKFSLGGFMVHYNIIIYALHTVLKILYCVAAIVKLLISPILTSNQTN